MSSRSCDVAEVTVRLAVLVAVVLVNTVLGYLPMPSHDIADGHDLHLRKTEKTAQVSAALPSHADPAHHDPVVGRHGTVQAERGPGNHQRRGDRSRRQPPAEIDDG